jgi:hypothetical protein
MQFLISSHGFRPTTDTEECSYPIAFGAITKTEIPCGALEEQHERTDYEYIQRERLMAMDKWLNYYK